MVKHATTSAITLSYWFVERLRLSASLPVLLHGSGGRVWASPVPYPAILGGICQGDLTLAAAWQAWRSAEAIAKLRTTVALDLTLPTGQSASYLSDAHYTAGLTLALSGMLGKHHYSLSTALRRDRTPYTAHSERLAARIWLMAAWGRSFYFERLQASFELPVSAVVRSSVPVFSAANLRVPAVLALRFNAKAPWALTVGVGSEITRAPGSARWRVLLAIDFVPWASQPKHQQAADSELLLTSAPVDMAEQPASAHSAPPNPLATSPDAPIDGGAARAEAAQDARDAASVPIPVPSEQKNMQPAAGKSRGVDADMSPHDTSQELREAPGNESDVTPIVARTTKVLPQLVHFQLNSDALSSDSLATLDELARWLKGHPEALTLRVLGYTDDRGPVAFNLDLATSRARQVARALEHLGILPHRLCICGLGPVQFVAPNASRAGRMMNRRVSFEVHFE